MNLALVGILVVIEATIFILDHAKENAGFVFWLSIWIALLVAVNWIASVLVFSSNTKGGSKTAIFQVRN